MKAVILAAGEGKRLRPLTESRPKVMLPVGNKPILQYVVEALRERGVKDIVMVVGYRKERIMSHFEGGKSFGVEITYAHQDRQLGSAHALMMAEPFVDEDFIVVPGDNIIDPAGFSKLMNAGVWSLLLTKSDNPSKYGVAITSGRRVVKIVEKPLMTEERTICTGAHYFPVDVFDILSDLIAEGRYTIPDLLDELINRKVRLKYALTDGWMDAVFPHDLIEMNRAVLSRMSERSLGKIADGVEIWGRLRLGPDSTLYPGTFIEGDVLIGEGCEIGPHTVIVGPTTIGDNTVIRPFTTVRGSLIMSDVRIEEGVKIDSAVIADGVVVGGNVVLRGRGAVEVGSMEEMIENKGPVIGEDTFIGDGTVIEPDVIVGCRCHISSMSRVLRNIRSDTWVV